MTSTPASRRAREITLIPRSWPSRPTFAVRMRIRLAAASFPATRAMLAMAEHPESGLGGDGALGEAVGDGDSSVGMGQMLAVGGRDRRGPAAGSGQSAGQPEGD